MKATGERIVFIGGLPRSGTTLLQNILDCHANILGGPEFDRIPNIVDLRRKMHNSISARRIDYFLTKDDVDNAIGNLIEAMLLPAAVRHGKNTLSEKTPWNILAFPDLIDILPSAKFIHVIRDPRAVVSSMVRVAEKGNQEGVKPPDFTTSIALALYYAESVYKIADICMAMAPARFITVRFEDLVQKSEAESRRICNFLQLPWDRGMLFPADKQHPGEAQMTHNSIWYDKKMYARNPEASALNAWRGELDSRNIAFVNEVLRHCPSFMKYGYDLSDVAIGDADQAAAHALHTTYRTSFNFAQLPLRVLQ